MPYSSRERARTDILRVAVIAFRGTLQFQSMVNRKRWAKSVPAQAGIIRAVRIVRRRRARDLQSRNAVPAPLAISPVEHTVSQLETQSVMLF